MRMTELLGRYAGRRGLRIGFDLAFVRDRSDGTSIWTCRTIELLARHYPQHTFYLLHAAPWPPGPAANGLTGPNLRRVLLHPTRLTARIRRRLGLLHAEAEYVRALRRLHVLHWNPLSEAHFTYLHLVPELPKIVTLHDATTDLFPEYHTTANIAMWERHYRRVEETGSWWLTVSQSSQRDLVRLRGLDAARSGVVYQSGRFTAHLAATADAGSLERFGLRPGQYVLCVGVLEPRKNQLQLIRAFRALKEGELRGSPWKLVLAGGQGWKFEEIVAAAQGQPDIILTGKVEDHVLADLYRHAALFAYPSFYEGFGLPVVEAMQFGLPVITSNVSSLPEVAGDAAVLIDPADVGPLREGLARLLAQPEDRARRSRLSLERAHCFSEQRQAEGTMSLLQRVVASRSDARSGRGAPQPSAGPSWASRPPHPPIPRPVSGSRERQRPVAESERADPGEGAVPGRD